jgi:hypothetical protein
MSNYRKLALAVSCGLLAACQDLTVDDETRPSVSQSLGSVSNIETSVGSATKYWLGGVVMGASVNQGSGGFDTFAPAIDGLNDAMTFGLRSSTLPATSVIDEPRTVVDHNPASYRVNKAPYQDAYSAIATCHDIRMKIADSTVQWSSSPRARIVCKLVMGFSHLYLGTMFDKAILVQDDLQPIDLSNQNFRPHGEVIDLAKKQIREGISESIVEAQRLAATVPASTIATSSTSWVNGIAYSLVDWAKIGYGYLARAEVWKAATPAEREDITRGGLVDWNKVIQYVDSSISATWTIGTALATLPTTNLTAGMTGPNFTVRGSQTIASTQNNHLYNIMYSGANNYYRFNHKFLGPGDTTGAYVTYLSTRLIDRKDTVYASPDRRLPLRNCTGGTLCARHVSTPTASNFVEAALPGDGRYFQLLANTGAGNLALTSNASPTPGYRQSSYQFIRFGGSVVARRTNNPVTMTVSNEFQTVMTPEELRLLKAEAYIRLGQAALAVPLINTSRTDANKGGLPAVGVNGPTQGYPQCVPHSFADATKCGTLIDALLWEKRLEALGTDMFVNWADWRAFGYLEPGSIVYFPPSSRETEAMGLPYYTYGPGLPGTAGTPTCPATSTQFQFIGCTNYTPVRRLPQPPL